MRSTPKSKVRGGEQTGEKVAALEFSYDAEKTADAVDRVRTMPGISYVRVWLADGTLDVGDDIMLVLVGGDIRPHVISALESLVEELKTQCVTEREIYAD